MSKVLLINPNVWGRGITPIWIASHSAILKNGGHIVELFDGTFYKEWSVNEIEFNTENKQYKPSNYYDYITLKETDIYEDLLKTINKLKPDIIFISAFSSHIHGEGEYVNIQYGYKLIENINCSAFKIAGGLQPTAQPEKISNIFPRIDYIHIVY